jgi:P-type Ca2+ transporter type 2C
MENEVKEIYHSLSVRESLIKLGSNKNGLSEGVAKRLLVKYGVNELTKKKRINPIFVYLKQFNSLFVYILIIAGAISYFVNNLVDVYVIGAIVLINASIGFFQEYKAEKSIDALKKMIVPYAKVYRGGELLKIPASKLVPGDIISLEEGDRIPADARLLDIKNFTSIESSLTGESVPVVKSLDTLEKGIALADRKNMVWMGTFVGRGAALGIVIGTGNNTVIGSIAKDIDEIKTEKSHFQKKTDFLAMQMGIIAVISAIVIFLVGYFIRNISFTEILLFTIASLVSSIPEGLPAILAIVLAVGAFRMSRRKAIIRKLPATETLAVVNTIITDKTGTLTENTMTVRKIVLAGEKEIEVLGNGWEPNGEMKQGKREIVPLEKNNLRKLLHIAGVCNNANLIRRKNKKNQYEILGDPTEAALVVLAEKAGLKKNVLFQKEKKIYDMPFNQKMNLRSSLLQNLKKEKEIYVVGAPEVVLGKCEKILKGNTVKKMTEIEKNEIDRQIFNLTNKAMRVLALAYREGKGDNISEEDINNLIYVGVVGIIDPPREEVKDAISKARKAGIRVIMATGDHKNTAIAIAKEIGLDDKNGVLTGEELDKLNVREFSKVVWNVNVFARLSPHMKLKIAETLQKRGDVVAMTGDGVNDAPALKKADIGISMGIIGTDVARESSEIVLADDNFASIINAIEEGRIVFTNTRQASFLLATTNFAEAMTILTTLSIGLPLPLLPTQILWLNLVTDTGPGLGLAVEPGHNHIKDEGPKNSKENILTREVLPFLILMSVTMLVLTLITFLHYLGDGLQKARTGAFVVMSLTQLFNSLNMRSLNKSLFKIGFWSNKYFVWFLVASLALIITVLYVPFFQKVFDFASFGILDFVVLLGLSSSVLWAGEGYKKFKNRKKN